MKKVLLFIAALAIGVTSTPLQKAEAQDQLDYALLSSLIAVASIAAIHRLGQEAERTFQEVADHLASDPCAEQDAVWSYMQAEYGQTGYSEADLNGDNKVDFADFLLLSNSWDNGC